MSCAGRIALNHSASPALHDTTIDSVDFLFPRSKRYPKIVELHMEKNEGGTQIWKAAGHAQALHLFFQSRPAKNLCEGHGYGKREHEVVHSSPLLLYLLRKGGVLMSTTDIAVAIRSHRQCRFYFAAFAHTNLYCYMSVNGRGD